MSASKDDYIFCPYLIISPASVVPYKTATTPTKEALPRTIDRNCDNNFTTNKTAVNKMFNASKVGELEQTKTKRSYSYKDITKLEAKNLYSSMGKMIESRKPTSNRATFGKAERKDSKKVLEPFRMAEIDNIGKESKGPGAYLPPRHVLDNGQLIETKDPTEKMKYTQTPSYKFGKSEKKGQEKERYNYMNYKNDELEVDKADLKRRNSTPAILIGTKQRFPDERADKITPGPMYDPTLKPDVPAAPKFTLGSRRSIKGQDPLVPTTSTTNLVGPGTYFQKIRSQSTGNLNRVPLTSTIKKEPAVTFAKGPKSLAQYKSSVDETYDIKTKTIMAHYDFQYDAGKGLHSGLSYMKKNIINSSERPLQKNKMKSYTMAVASREKEQKRGTFISMMSNTPAPVRMNHPKF